MKKYIIFLIGFSIPVFFLYAEDPVASNLMVEYTTRPLGIDTYEPVLSWIINDSDRGEKQTSFRIIVASSQEKIDADEGDVWDTDEVVSDEQIIQYDGLMLTSKTRYWWKVATWDVDHNQGSFSEASYFETAMLSENDWTAKWIGFTETPNVQMMRSEFTLPSEKTVKKARAYVSGVGYFELLINGTKIGDHVLDPVYPQLDKRSYYASFDITDNIATNGENAVGLMLGNGWAAGSANSPNFNRTQKMSLRGICQLEIEFTDGTRTTINSNSSSWKGTSQGPVYFNNIYDGEHYDARKEANNWAQHGFDDSDWSVVSEVEDPKTSSRKLTSQLQAIKVIETYKPKSVTNLGGGKFLIDAGQQVSGWVRLKVMGQSGTEIILQYDANGTNRNALQQDRYTLKGGGEEIWEPRFVYHGFNTVTVSGFPGIPTVNDFDIRIVHSDIGLENTFNSSDKMLDDLYKMYNLSQRDNCMGIPTDCNQRDERQAWGGDAVVTSESTLYHFNNSVPFFRKWAHDIDDIQGADGSGFGCAPTFVDDSGATWGAIMTHIPWDVYMFTGDVSMFKKHYQQMKNYVNWMAGIAGSDYLGVSGQWGDHSTIDAKEKPFLGNSFFYQSALLMTNVAGLLGYRSDSIAFASLAENTKNAINNVYLKGNHYSVSHQTANGVALHFDLVPPEKRDLVMKNLTDEVEVVSNNHLNVGCLGSKSVIEALYKNDRNDIVYNISKQKTYPSWGHMRYAKNLTTPSERWENDDTNDSDNHPFLMGGFGSWIFKGFLGVSPLEAGFKKIQLKPLLNKTRSASGSLHTVKGLISTGWEKNSNGFVLSITIPANTEAIVLIPTLGYPGIKIKESDEIIWNDSLMETKVSGINFNHSSDKYIVWNIGSGKYNFDVVLSGKVDTCSIIPFVNVDNTGWESVSSVIVPMNGVLWFEPQLKELSGEEGNWSWTGPNNTTFYEREWIISDIQLNQSGIYTVNYNSQSGCTATQSFTVTVNDPDDCTIVPYVNVNNQGWENISIVKVTPGSEVWFRPESRDFGSSENGWRWTGPNGLNIYKRTIKDSNIKLDQTGEYLVTNTDEAGCVSTHTFTIIVDEILNIGVEAANKNSRNSIHIYPNPVNEESFFVKVEDVFISEIAIFSIEGNELYHKIINQNTTISPLINWSPNKSGIYVVKILDTQENMFTTKLMVN